MIADGFFLLGTWYIGTVKYTGGSERLPSALTQHSLNVGQKYPVIFFCTELDKLKYICTLCYYIFIVHEGC